MELKDLAHRLRELRGQQARHPLRARAHALQALLPWVDEQLPWVDEKTPPPTVPIKALDRGEIYGRGPK